MHTFFDRFVLLVLSGLLLGCLPEGPTDLPKNEQPMYGGMYQSEPKNATELARVEELKAADRDFIESVMAAGHTEQFASNYAVDRGWSFFRDGDYSTAIKRFNQAWLLDKENGDAYYGFALVTIVRDELEEEAESFFLTALSKPNVSVDAYVDYGRFLWSTDRLDESTEILLEAIAILPTARNAHSHLSHVHYLKRDFSEACRWGRRADSNGDELEDGYLEYVCGMARDMSR